MDADSGHRVDTIAPTISTIAITSDSGSDYTYRTGDTIQVTVTFSEDVTVTGTPQLELFFNQSGAVQASYVNVTGAAVVFEYTVTAEDESDLGIAIRSNKLDLNGGSIGDAAGNDAVLDNSTVDADPGHLVNRAGGL